MSERVSHEVHAAALGGRLQGARPTRLQQVFASKFDPRVVTIPARSLSGGSRSDQRGASQCDPAMASA